VNLLLDEYADNPVIDELVFRPPKKQRIVSIRACSVLFRKPFISEFNFDAVEDRERLVAEVLARRDECIAESNLMFDEGMYAQFLAQSPRAT